MTDQRTQTLTERLEAIHNLLADKLPELARIAVALYDRETDMLHTLAHSSSGENPLPHYGAMLTTIRSLREILDTQNPRVVHDIPMAYSLASEHSRRIVDHGYRSSYTAPLFHRDHFLGFVFFNAYEPNVFSEHVLPVIECAANLVALSVGEDLDASRILMGAIIALGKVARMRDPETGEHLERMARFSREIALRVADAHNLSDELIENLFLYAPLHDIGKLAMPDAILLKPAVLDPHEWSRMQQHPQRGCEIVQVMLDNAAAPFPHVDLLMNVIRHHHERFDGRGYPDGLAGEAIPIEARIVAVADSFDALTTHRPYKAPWSNAEAIDWISARTGTRFDPDCVAALIASLPQLERIQACFVDPVDRWTAPTPPGPGAAASDTSS